MKKETIEKTAVCYWSKQDDCFVVRSPSFDNIAGTGETAQEAVAMFQDMLDDWYPSITEGRVVGYDKAGRPLKGGVALNCLVKPETKQRLERLTKRLGMSYGEVVDYLQFFYEVTKDAPFQQTPPKQLAIYIADLVSERLAQKSKRPSGSDVA